MPTTASTTCRAHRLRPFGRFPVQRALLLATCVGLLLTVGCNEQRRYEVLSFFFDGVPHPTGEGEEDIEYVRGPWGIRLRADDPRVPELRERFARRELSDTADAGPDGGPVVEFLHAPYEDRVCNGCHAVADSFTIPATDVETCRDCHAQHVQYERTDWVHGPVASGQCMTCHEPHKSPYRGLLVNRQPDMCFECHDAQGILEQPYHAEVVDVLLASDRLGGKAKVQPTAQSAAEAASSTVLTDESAAVQDAAGEGGSAAANTLEAGTPMVMANDQTPEPRDAAVVRGARRDFVCTRCHDPHAAGNRLLLADSRSYKLRRRTAAQAVSAHVAWTDDDCGKCHLRDKSNVLAQDIDAVCIDCHDSVDADIRAAQAQAGRDTQDTWTEMRTEAQTSTPPTAGHSPASGASRPRLHEALLEGGCTTCHTPHQSMLDHLIKPAGEALCFRCHKPEEVQTPEHPIVHRVDCLSCHTGHHVERPHMLKPGIPTGKGMPGGAAVPPSDRVHAPSSPSTAGRMGHMNRPTESAWSAKSTRSTRKETPG